MKTYALITLGGICTLLLMGCASQSIPASSITMSSVGPDSLWYDPAGLHDTGYLKVYSATRTRVIGDGPPYYTHTGYNIYDLSGKPVRYVRNHTGDMDRMPAPVRIASGRYRVVAKSSYCGRVTVPVVIQPGKTTELYLDGSWRPDSKDDTNSIVYLPDGDAVGWKCATMDSTK
jgi:hypothetical protein